MGDSFGQPVQFGQPVRILGQAGRQHRQGRETGGVGFGGGHTTLRASVQIQAIFDLGSQRRTEIVGDGQGQRSLLATFGDDGHNVRRLAGLGDTDDQGIRQPGWPVIQREQGWHGQPDRESV